MGDKNLAGRWESTGEIFSGEGISKFSASGWNSTLPLSRESLDIPATWEGYFCVFQWQWQLLVCSNLCGILFIIYRNLLSSSKNSSGKLVQSQYFLVPLFHRIWCCTLGISVWHYHL